MADLAQPGTLERAIDDRRSDNNVYPMESLSHRDDLTTDMPSFTLEPADRGRSAWLVLITSFTFEALFWGFPACFGVFQDHYSNLPQYRDNKNIPLIGTIAQSLVFLGAPFSAFATKRMHRYQSQQLWLGWILCIVGLLSASFASTIDGLIATQGFVYGLGVVTLTYPNVSMLSEWWITRKGMAFGLISAASGATGSFLPFILDVLLRKYGYKVTLRASAVTMLVISAPLLPFLKGRLPPSERSVLARIDLSFVYKPLFWVYAAATLVQGLGFFFAPVFLPSFSTTVGFTSLQGAALLCIMSISQIAGQFVIGWLSDSRISVTLLAPFCCIMAAIASYVFWGLGHTLALLVMFSMIYGFFGFGFGTLRVAMGRAVSDGSSLVATYSVFVFLQGVGNAVLGPLSTVLLSGDVKREEYAAGRYRGLVLMTGSASLAASLIMTFWQTWTSVQICRHRE